jgi:hypothetical protein
MMMKRKSRPSSKREHHSDSFLSTSILKGEVFTPSFLSRVQVGVNFKHVITDHARKWKSPRTVRQSTLKSGGRRGSFSVLYLYPNLVELKE